MKTAIPLSPLLIPLSPFLYMQSAFFFLFSAGSFFRFHSISLRFPSVHLALLFCSLTLPSFSFSLIFQNLPVTSLSCLFLPSLVFSSLSPLGSVPAPLPWHWANSSPPLRLLLPSLLSSIPLASDWWPLYSGRRGRETEREGERAERGAAKHTWT